MKKIITIILFLTMLSLNSYSQETPSYEKYGNTLNAGFGLGYYGYVGRTFPVVHANFEFDLAKNFTLAPFITYYAYKNHYYWGNHKHPYRHYSYRQTVVLAGAKGTYYFDQILKAGAKWDFYLAASAGFAFRRTTWENEYYGDTNVSRGASGLYLDGHIGTEYHLSQKVGLFLDLSTGLSTFGLSFHL